MNRIVAALTMVAFMSHSVAATDEVFHQIINLLHKLPTKYEQVAVLRKLFKFYNMESGGQSGPAQVPYKKPLVGIPQDAMNKSLAKQLAKMEKKVEGPWKTISKETFKSLAKSNFDTKTFLILATPKHLTEVVVDVLDEGGVECFSDMCEDEIADPEECPDLWELFSEEEKKWFADALRKCKKEVRIETQSPNSFIENESPEFDIQRAIAFAKEQGVPLFIHESELQNWNSYLTCDWKETKHSVAETFGYTFFVAA